MNISWPQLREALHLLHQMLWDAMESWQQKHFTEWRAG